MGEEEVGPPQPESVDGQDVGEEEHRGGDDQGHTAGQQHLWGELQFNRQ